MFRSQPQKVHSHCRSANPFPDALAQFGQLLWTEDQDGDHKDHQQVHRLKQSFEHIATICYFRTGDYRPDSAATQF